MFNHVNEKIRYISDPSFNLLSLQFAPSKQMIYIFFMRECVCVGVMCVFLSVRVCVCVCVCVCVSLYVTIVCALSECRLDETLNFSIFLFIIVFVFDSVFYLHPLFQIVCVHFCTCVE